MPENQIGVFLAHATGRGRMLDRRLYLSTSWAGDRDWCRRAGHVMATTRRDNVVTAGPSTILSTTFPYAGATSPATEARAGPRD